MLTRQQACGTYYPYIPSIYTPCLPSPVQDQVWSLRAKGVRSAFLASTLTAGERRATLDSLTGPEPPLLLYVTPELLATQFKGKLAELRRRGALLCLAVDEAHCISSW